MLSTGAFNALLKTLEEPPAHVKFILATTEPQKLPATILSRCQRFDFKKLSNENIVKRLNIVCNESKINVEESALKIIASLSEGAMRDALSILERCLQDGDNDITEDKIKELVGIPKITYIEQITESVIKKDVETVLKVIKEVIAEGKDQGNFLWEVIKYVKDLLLYKVTGETGIHSEKEVEKLKEISTMVEKEELVHLIYELSELENNMKWSTQKTIMFETGIIKNCIEVPNQSLEQRVESLEKQIKSGNIKIENTIKAENKPKTVNKQEEPKTKKIQREIISEPGEYVSFWSEVINKLKSSGKIMVYTNLINTKAKQVNDTLQIEFKNGLTAFGKTVLSKPENIEEISNIVNSISGKEFKIKYIEGNLSTPKEENNINLDGLDIPINIIEE